MIINRFLRRFSKIFGNRVNISRHCKQNSKSGIDGGNGNGSINGGNGSSGIVAVIVLA